MKRFKNFLPLIETSLNKAALQDPVGQGPNSGKPRIEIFANKIKNGEEHILDDGSMSVYRDSSRIGGGAWEIKEDILNNIK